MGSEMCIRDSSGSYKDRIALRMIEGAEKRGLLKPGYTIVESSSGNTAIALAMVGAVKGYKVKIFYPEEVWVEEKKKIFTTIWSGNRDCTSC